MQGRKDVALMAQKKRWKMEEGCEYSYAQIVEQLLDNADKWNKDHRFRNIDISRAIETAISVGRMATCACSLIMRPVIYDMGDHCLTMIPIMFKDSPYLVEIISDVHDPCIIRTVKRTLVVPADSKVEISCTCKPEQDPDPVVHLGDMEDEDALYDGCVIEYDAVDHPLHYGGEDDPYEAIKVIEAWLDPREACGFYIGNAIKYICRAGKKGDFQEDIRKAIWYLDRAVKACD